MLAIQIDNKELEQTLFSQFHTSQNIKEYLYNLVVEDLEDKELSKLIEEDNKKDFVSKNDVFDVLNNI